MPDEIFSSIPLSNSQNYFLPKAAEVTEVATTKLQKPTTSPTDITVLMNEPLPSPAVGTTTCSPAPYSAAPLPVIASARVQSLLPISFATKPTTKFRPRHTHFNAQQKKASISRCVEELTRLQQNKKRPPPLAEPTSKIKPSSCNQDLI